MVRIEFIPPGMHVLRITIFYMYFNFAGIPATKHVRAVATPTPAVPNLESISLSQAQIANPEMLFKVNNTAKYVYVYV